MRRVQSQQFSRVVRKFDSAPCRHFGSKPSPVPEGMAAFLDNWPFTLTREAIPQSEGLAEVVSADKGSLEDALAGSASRKPFCTSSHVSPEQVRVNTVAND